jgi:glycosyltransferase involved in cell wall biosynthesis
VRPRLLYVHSRKASFVAIDRELLAERYEVRDWYQPGRMPNLFGLIPALLRSDVVLGWFASWHTFWPITLAWLLRKPSVMIIGGFDVANMPEIGYGYQQGGLRRWASRWIINRASRLITNSHYSREEIARNIGEGLAGRVEVIHHGVPDPWGPLSGREREPLAISVGHIVHNTLEQKGQRPFVDAAARLPDVRFVLVGKAHDDAIEELRARAPGNVEFAGWLSQEDLEDLYARASVYVQASLHEGFGMAVAEGMLAGCIPVVTAVTAMPEVVGDAGVQIRSPDPDDVAEGVRQALSFDAGAPTRARGRILEEFPLEKRREALLRVVEEALAGPKRKG